MTYKEPIRFLLYTKMVCIYLLNTAILVTSSVFWGNCSKYCILNAARLYYSIPPLPKTDNGTNIVGTFCGLTSYKSLHTAVAADANIYSADVCI